MLNDHTVAVIGAGNIGRALIGGMLTAGERTGDALIEAERVTATRRSADALAELAEEFPGLRTATNNATAAREASIVILAVKPQSADAVIAEIKDVTPPGALVISVLAGRTTAQLEADFGSDEGRERAVVRAMPNTPALVDEGATALAAGRFATDEDVRAARQILGAVGQVEVVEEELMDAVTGLSGSGPAYVYMFIEALTDAGVKQGLKRQTAAELAAQTVYGAARLAVKTEKHPAILRDEVTTPGGTAIAAVAELEDHGLRTMLINAVATATERSGRLADESE